MLEQFLLLVGLTSENLVHFGAMYLLWSPIALLTFSCCYCGTMLILQQCDLTKGGVALLWGACCLVLTVSELLSWQYFVLGPCRAEAGLPLEILAIAVVVVVLITMVWISEKMVKKYGFQDDVQNDESKITSDDAMK